MAAADEEALRNDGALQKDRLGGAESVHTRPMPGTHLTRAIRPLDQPPHRTVIVPGSKSHTNRALVCAALAEGTSHLSGALFADDTEAMLGVLGGLGVDVVADAEATTVAIVGTAGDVPSAAGPLDSRQSGTTGRFVLPMLALGAGRNVLDGAEQLRARPFGELVDAIQTLGGRVEGERLPLMVHGGGLAGGTVQVSGAISSQFLSGLLLSAPCAESDVVIEITDELVSKPYIDLTITTMASFGVDVINDDYRRFVVPAIGYRAADVAIEPDASAASYFFAAAAITGGTIEVPGLGSNTVQGDLGFVRALEAMGATVTVGESSTIVTGPEELEGIDIDMADISDTAQTLAAVAPFATSPTRVDGVGFIRFKETDRIAAICNELSRLGVRAEQTDDGFTITPGDPSPGIVDTYDDHRMAMSFALLGLRAPGIVIADPGCVRKTFPTYFSVLDQLAVTS